MIKVRSYEMNWAADGKGPWGSIEDSDKTLSATYNGESLVIVWRQVADGYCWDGVYSNELRGRLENGGKNTVTVEYNTFWDFGEWAGTTVKSIDGVAFYEGDKSLRPNTNAFGGHHWVKEPIIGLCNN